MHIGLSESGGRVLQIIMITRYSNTSIVNSTNCQYLSKSKTIHQTLQTEDSCFKSFEEEWALSHDTTMMNFEHKTKLEFFISIITFHCTFDSISGTLTEQTTIERQRERHQTKYLMSTMIALHVHFNLCAFLFVVLYKTTT